MVFDYRTEYHRYRRYYLDLKRFYKNPVAKVSIFVLLSFITVVFFSLFAIKPTLVTIGELVKSIETKREVDKLLSRKIQALNELQGKLLAAQNDIPLIYSVLPESPSLGRLMQLFEYITQRENVGLLAAKFDRINLGETTDTAAQVVSFSVSAGGSFANLKSFLNTMENVDRLMVFDEVKLLSSSFNFSQSGLEIVVDISGKAFFLNDSLEESEN